MGGEAPLERAGAPPELRGDAAEIDDGVLGDVLANGVAQANELAVEELPSGLLVGSVSNKVGQLAPCPCLTVK